MAKMKKDELEALLSQQQHVAIGALNGTIGKHRANLADRYNGEPYGDEVKDRTTIVDTSVRDTIESIKPELMDIFYGGDRVVEFAPTNAEDVDAASQETDVIDHVFNQKNDGFMILYNWFTDALLLKVGYVKRYWDERKWVDIEEYDDLSPEEAANLVEELEGTSDEVEFLERDGGIDDETGEVSPMYLKIKRTKKEKRYTVEGVPPEQVFVSPQWNRLDFKDCPFVAHKRPIPVSDLIEMGFDRKQVETLPDHDAKMDSEEAENRFDGEYFDESGLSQANQAMREVLVFENYIRVDYDGDGVAELVQVFTAGEQGEILKRNGKDAVEQVSDTPFEALCPLPIPHKHFGLSIGEIVMDLQRIKTVLTRQMLDNIIINNNPDTVIDEDQATTTTYDDIALTQPGRNIRIPGGMASIGVLPVLDTSASSLNAIQYIDSLRETRTGVTRYNQGLDADALAPLAQGTVKGMMSAAQKKILLIARIFAETGVKSLFQNMHRDMRNGPWKEIAIQLNGEFISVNPRMWKHRTDMTVNVGLGSGDRDIQFQRLGFILQQQKEGLQVGFTGYEHIHHTLMKMTELSGFKDTSRFFPDPQEVAQAQSQQEPQPDPAQMLAQVEMQKAQMAHQAKMADNQIKAQANQLKEKDQKIKQLEILMRDDRERDLAGAKIEADEAARMAQAVDGQRLTAK